MTLPTKAADLQPDPKNPRHITAEQRRRLARSMKRFGDLGGIIYNAQTGHLVGAHQRLSNVPKNTNVHIDEDQRPDQAGDRWGHINAHGHRWPVRVVDWPEDKERAANIAANAHWMQGEFSLDILAEQLPEIELDDIGLDAHQVEALFDPEVAAGILGFGDLTDESLEPEGVQKSMQQLEEQGQVGERGGDRDKHEQSLGADATAAVDGAREDQSNWRVVVFGSDKEAEEFCRALGLRPDTRFIQASHLIGNLARTQSTSSD
tara:strand:- start:706 stop:1491 length:786 start_codon:yes stop_codon:yes gene_type:complete